jgi:hypothetical protein
MGLIDTIVNIENACFYVKIINNGTVPAKNIHIVLRNNYCIALTRENIDIDCLEKKEQRKIQFGVNCRTLSETSPTSVVFDIEYCYKKWFRQKVIRYSRKIEF